MNRKRLRAAGRVVLVAAILIPSLAFGAFVAGGIAYTKRVETALLSEPRALAPVAARVGYAKQLKVEEVRGAWLRVREGKNAGWVFAGNVAQEKPEEKVSTVGLLAASETSAAAAARPLAPAAVEYGSRHGMQSAAADLAWLHEETDAITPEQVDEFLKEQQKGEYQ